jgi:formylglycine-generating enzyme required for sulfatase activity
MMVVVLAVGWWKQDLLKGWVMGLSLLTAELEKEKAENPGSDFKECANGCPTMIVVPAGRFIMGSPEKEIDRYEDEGPQHEVTIARSFAVSKTEVTFAQWDALVCRGCLHEGVRRHLGTG